MTELAADRAIDTEPNPRRWLILAVVGAGRDVPELAFHVLVPAARWWDDIVFT